MPLFFKLSLFLLLIIGFQSCSIEKRVHRKGYHLEWNKTYTKTTRSKTVNPIDSKDKLINYTNKELPNNISTQGVKKPTKLISSSNTNSRKSIVRTSTTINKTEEVPIDLITKKEVIYNKTEAKNYYDSSWNTGRNVWETIGLNALFIIMLGLLLTILIPLEGGFLPTLAIMLPGAAALYGFILLMVYFPNETLNVLYFTGDILSILLYY